GDADELAHALGASDARTMPELRESAAGYIGAQPFRASSTLLFVGIPAGTAGRRPELLSSQPTPGGNTGAREAQRRLLRQRLEAAPEGYSTVEVPGVGKLRLLRRSVRLHGIGDRPVTLSIGAGTPLASVSKAQRGVARAFILAGALALIAAFLA